MPKPRSISHRIDALRKGRARPDAAKSVGTEIDRLMAALHRQRGAMGGLDEIWMELGPRSAGKVIGEVRGFSPGGILTVRVGDASARYEVEVWLRSGGLDALRARTSRTLRRVRLEIAAG
jgi:hypothetical protein